MANLLVERPGRAMAKKKSAESNVRVEAEVARLAKMVASFEDRSISEVLSDILRPVLQRRYEEHIKKAQADISKSDSGKPPRR